MTVFTRTEIAARLGISESRVRQLLAEIVKLVPTAIEAGRVTEIGLAELELYRSLGKAAWLAAKTAQTATEPQQPQQPQQPQPEPQTPTYTLIPVNSALASAEPPLLPTYHIPSISSQIAHFDKTQQTWLEQAGRLTGVADAALTQAAELLATVRAQSANQVTATDQAVRATRLKLAALQTQADLTQEQLISDAVRRDSGLSLGKSLQGQLDGVLTSIGLKAVSE